MDLITSASFTKDQIFENIRQYLSDHAFTIVNEEYRPWGGFFVLDEDQAGKFINEFKFSVENSQSVKLSPKILVVESGKRLSWQYHERRAEWWKVIGGSPGIITNTDDEEKAVVTLQTGAYIKLRQGERHRLIGLENWGIVAEIWQHTDKNNPSNEDDITRLQDDFGR